MKRGAQSKPTGNQPDTAEAPAHHVRLPGFLIEEEIGLGDVIKRVTYAMGVRPCQGCDKRAAVLNRWIHFSR